MMLRLIFSVLCLGLIEQAWAADPSQPGPLTSSTIEFRNLVDVARTNQKETESGRPRSAACSSTATSFSL